MKVNWYSKLAFAAAAVVVLCGSQVEAAPFATDVALNGMKKQFVSVKDLMNTTPEQFLEGAMTGPSSLGAGSESEVPLGQYIYVEHLSGFGRSVYAIFDKLGVVKTARLFGVDNTPIHKNNGGLNAPSPAVNYPQLSSSGGLYGTPSEPAVYTPGLPTNTNIDFGVGSDPTPEPASLTLMAAGLLMLSKRQRKQG